MQPHKLENFARASPGQTFPPFRNSPLVNDADLYAQFGLQDFANLNAFIAGNSLEYLQDIETEYDTGTMNLHAWFSLINVPLPHEISTYCFDDNGIDTLLFSDFETLFYYIWYPSAEDILLFDPNHQWVFFLTHYYALYYKKA